MTDSRYLLREAALEAALWYTDSSSDVELATYLRRSAQTIRSWRRGRACPDLDALLQLRKLTGWAVEDLVYEVAETHRVTSTAHDPFLPDAYSKGVTA